MCSTPMKIVKQEKAKPKTAKKPKAAKNKK
jgi:hypothetical protein